MRTTISNEIHPAQAVQPVRPVASKPRWLVWLQIALNETLKGLQLQWSYKFNLLTEITMLGFVFVGIGFFMGGGELDPEALAPALLGYVTWFYAVVAIGEMSWSLRDEAQAGTLEQMYMSPVPSGIIRLGRTLSTLTVTTTVIVMMATVLIWLLGIQLPVRWLGVPILALTLIGVYGFGFMIGGATLIFKNVGSLGNMVQNALLFLNGAFLPVDRLPNWLEAVALTLPTTQGVVVLRQVVIEEATLATIWANGSLIWLILHSSLYFSLGWVVFALCERKAKEQGRLGQY